MCGGLFYAWRAYKQVSFLRNFKNVESRLAAASRIDYYIRRSNEAFSRN